MKKLILFFLTLVASTVGYADGNKEHVVHLGEHAIGEWAWDSYLTLDGSAFNDLSSGDVIYITLEEDVKAATAASKTWYQYNFIVDDNSERPTLTSGDLSSATSTIAFTPTDEQIAQIKANRLMVQGHFIKVLKVKYGPVNSTSLVSDDNNLPYDTKEWNVDALGINLDILRTAKVGDVVRFDINSTYLSDSRDWGCQAFLKGDNLEIGGSDLKDKTEAEYTLTAENITAIASTGYAQIVGKGVVFNNVYLITHDETYSLYADKQYIDLSQLNGQTVDVNMYRTFGNYWNTLCLPFDCPVSELGDAEIYTFKSYDSAANQLTFSPVTGESLTAGTPYLVNFGESPVSSLSARSVAINATLGSSASDGLTYTGNYTVGMDMEGNYGLAWQDGIGWCFYKGATGSDLNAFSAYFTGTVNSVKPLSISFSDETGIEEIQNPSTGEAAEPITGFNMGRDAIYDLTGRQIMKSSNRQLRTGLYIRNGKKVFIK